MSDARNIAQHLLEDCAAARAHFEAWWTLRNIAIPEFLVTMDELEYVDFFVATNAAHYKCFFIALGRIFDRDDRAAGVRELKKALRAEDSGDVADYIEGSFAPHEALIVKIMAIRNKAVAHIERALGREKVHDIFGITPDDIRLVINTACDTINETLHRLGDSVGVSDGERMQEATLHMLRKLRGAQPGAGADAPTARAPQR